MHRRTIIRGIVRIILFVNLLAILYIFSCILQKQDNPLLTFLTIGTIFAFLLVLLNPLFGRYSNDKKNIPVTLLLILLLAFQVLADLFVLSYAENVDLLSLFTLGLIASGLLSSFIAYSIAKLIYTEKEGLLTVFLMTLMPSHVYLGNVNPVNLIAETMILMSVLLVLYSFRHNAKTFAVLTTICAGSAFISASTLNFAYMLMVFPFFLFYLFKSIDRIKNSRYALRFLYFFGISGFVLAVTLVTDEMIGTRFWNVMDYKILTGTNAYESIQEISSRMTDLWSNPPDMGNNTINYMSSVLFVLLVFSFIAGILNSMKDNQFEYVLTSTYPLFLTAAYIFMQFDSTTILASAPFVAITASFGITGAFAFIPAMLKEYHTTLQPKPDIEIQLDDSFNLPGRWGPVLPVEANNCTEQTESEETIDDSDNTHCDEKMDLNMEESINEPNSSGQVEETVITEAEDTDDNNVLEILDLSLPDIEEKKEKTELEKVYEMFDISVPKKREVKNDEFDNISFSASNINTKEDSDSTEKKFTLKRAYVTKDLKFAKEEPDESKKSIDVMVDMLFENKNDKNRKK